MRLKPILLIYVCVTCSISFLLILSLFQILDSKQSESELMKSYQALKSKFENSLYNVYAPQIIPPKTKEISDAREAVMCDLESNPVYTNVETLHLYDTADFTDIDGGVWKQGWDITYNSTEWSSSRKLKVFLVPHSHNDPGWLKTFEDYFQSETKHILDNMVTKLSSTKEGKFIWAEISYLSLWWDSANDLQRSAVLEFIKRGQLEIVTGGWVMTDEANSHYYSMIEQLMSGHEWLKNVIGVTPRNGWSIDPFGLSPTMAYILKESGFKNMLIQRVHYIVKKHLAQQKNLEFYWRQIWDLSGENNILTHMMPFYSYDVPHTCGPDPKICCQFDFVRGTSTFSCPWGINAVSITNNNVEERALMLLDQYRKKAQLYKTPVLLVPLGDDFRYQSSSEWDLQFDNYERIFKYLNSRSDLNVIAQMGTLNDYFAALEDEIKTDFALPSLAGDFFTYADREDHYWSGYYSSRPFYKSMERELLHYLRTAEIFFSILHDTTKSHSEVKDNLYQILMSARHSLSLFQHHDGITGTARSHVVKDYADKKWRAIANCQTIIREATFLLLGVKRITKGKNIIIKFNENRPSAASLPENDILKVSLEKHLVILLNPSSHDRKELVTVRCDTKDVLVEKTGGSTIPIQISPVFTNGILMFDQFDISFILDLPALSITTTKLMYSPFDKSSKNTKVLYGKNIEIPDYPLLLEEIKPYVVLSTPKYSFKFHDGYLDSYTSIKTGVVNKLQINFVKYGTTNGMDKSGAYLFLPDGPAKTLDLEDRKSFGYIGKLHSKICVHGNLIQHCVTVFHKEIQENSVKIENLIDIRTQVNFEIGMRIKTAIHNNNIFYTDLNGHQVIKRKTLDKLPLQGNFYPLPKMGFIEDSLMRMTLMTKQPQGCASLKSGEFEVIMDRMLAQDDNRGLGQSIMDSVPLRQEFTLLLESVSAQVPVNNSMLGIPSLLANKLSFDLIHQPVILNGITSSMELKTYNYKFLHQSLPCDIEVDFMRVLPTNYVNGKAMSPSLDIGIVFHRYGTNCNFDMELPNCHQSRGKLMMKNIFPNSFAQLYEKTTLTFLQILSKHSKTDLVSMNPLEFKSFVFHINSA